MSRLDDLVYFVEARMGSQRFPGKVLVGVDKDCMNSLEMIIEKLDSYWMRGWVVTPNTPANIIIHKNFRRVMSPDVPENDVLGRYYKAAYECQAMHILRITADCPLINMKLIEKLADIYFEKEGRTYCALDVPNTVPDGMDAEIFSFGMLKKAHEEATDPYDREHVSPWIKRNYPVYLFKTSFDFSKIKLSLDTPKDLTRIKEWIARFS